MQRTGILSLILTLLLKTRICRTWSLPLVRQLIQRLGQPHLGHGSAKTEKKFHCETSNFLKHVETVRLNGYLAEIWYANYIKERQVRGTDWGKRNVEFILQAQRSREENKKSFRVIRPKSGWRSQGRNQFPKRNMLVIRV